MAPTSAWPRATRADVRHGAPGHRLLAGRPAQGDNQTLLAALRSTKRAASPGSPWLLPICLWFVKTADNPGGVEPRLPEEVRARLSKDRPRHYAVNAQAFFNACENSVSAKMMQWWTNMMLKASLRVQLDLQRMATETDFRPELSRIS